MPKTRPETTQTAASANLLDQAWDMINAEGGASTNDYERAFNDGIGKALEVIERLGGMNPSLRDASPMVRRVHKQFMDNIAEHRRR